MSRTLQLVTAAALCLSSACTATDYGPKETTGGLTGAVLGGLLGAQFGRGDGRLVTTGAGVLIGALIGSEIGRSMDDTDRLRANDAIRQAYTAPVGETVRWNNTRSGNYGTVTSCAMVSRLRQILSRIQTDHHHRRAACRGNRGRLPEPQWHMADRQLIRALRTVAVFTGVKF